jgi:hypothetical protein
MISSIAAVPDRGVQWAAHQKSSHVSLTAALPENALATLPPVS